MKRSHRVNSPLERGAPAPAYPPARDERGLEETGTEAWPEEGESRRSQRRASQRENVAARRWSRVGGRQGRRWPRVEGQSWAVEASDT
jgi:hypothetical protein